MRRSTHLLLGVAAAAPFAALAPPAGAVGCLCLGLIGGAFPDYLDLRSGAARHLKHRGLSHSGLVLGLSTVAVFIVLDAVTRADTDLMPLPATYARLWAAGFGLGVLSHLLSDACTRGGIQPLLPLSKRRYWLLPRFLRGRSEGRVNGLARLAAIVVLGVSLAIFLMVHTPLIMWMSVHVVGEPFWWPVKPQTLGRGV